MTQDQALKILKTGANVFLTGEPGSGKTYTINQYVAYLRSHKIEVAITASTGIAATHIGGMTIHSWSGIGIKDKLTKNDLRNIVASDYINKRIKKTKVLIIDEISMLPPNTLQMIDEICRKIKQNLQPFGGIQVVLVGDFFQLPPVIKKYFSENYQENFFKENAPRFAFDSLVWDQVEFITCYLTEQYRQDDDLLLSVLSKIRNGAFDEISLSHLKQRKIDQQKVPDNIPKLYSHNIDVDFVNDQMIKKIPGVAELFQMQSSGHKGLIAAMKKGCLSPEKLHLKIGASVMFTKNNQKDGYVNGTLGEVFNFDNESGLPIVKIRGGRKIVVSPADWTVEENGKIRGSLSQIPLRLAWAITVHKSQGISLDEAVVDLSKVFEFGQGYVALSRVRRLSGIYILGWNEIAFQVNPEVVKKDEEFRINSVEAERLFTNFSKQELEKRFQDFITRCGGELKASSTLLKPKVKLSTYEETFNLWEQGKTIKQIAEIRNLSENTILSHIEKLVANKKVSRADLMAIISVDLLLNLPLIHQEFKKYEDDRLTPIFEFFNGRYSYEELKIARMMID